VTNVQRCREIRRAFGAIAFGCARTHHCLWRIKWNFPWLRLSVVSFAGFEIEPIRARDGSAALICIDCDLIGINRSGRSDAASRAAWP
jgi:hypothetical protein